MTSIKSTTARGPDSTRLEGKFASEQRKLNRGVRAGTITSGEAKGLQSKLDALHGRFSKDAFESSGATDLKGYRDALKKLQGEREGAAGNAEVDLEARSANIDKRIENGLNNGSLTQSEASALKEKAAALKTELAAATDPAAKQALAQKFEALSKEVRAERHDEELDPAKRKANFEKRIEKGIADGSLTEAEATQLKEKLAKLNEDPGAINALSRDIFKARHNGEVDTAKMGDALRTKLGSTEGTAPSDPAQFDALQKQLEGLLSPGALDASVRLNTMRERLNAMA